jgi:hypothetical protein
VQNLLRKEAGVGCLLNVGKLSMGGEGEFQGTAPADTIPRLFFRVSKWNQIETATPVFHPPAGFRAKSGVPLSVPLGTL